MAARLDHLHILSGAPDRLAAFYGEAFEMTPERLGPDLWLCSGPMRRVLIGRGQPRTLGFSAYGFEGDAGLAAMRERLERRRIAPDASPSPLFGPEAFAVHDPDGNTVVFGHGRALGAASEEQRAQTLRGRLQHVALCADHPETLLSYYMQVLGCTLSDTVADDRGLAACWLRTDPEHHTVAVFRTRDAGGREAGTRFDHHAYEVEDWDLIRDWSDHFAARGIPLVWGPGRHGPGNNLFIMIRDPDGNLVEFSAELEVITTGRPPRVWPATESTFNRWGSAALRT